MAGDFRGRVGLVTGGASGIGRAAVQQFVARGARIVIADVQDDLGAGLAKEIREAGAEAEFVHADLSQEADAEQMVALAVDTFGDLNFAFNSAGINGRTFVPFHETPLDDWQRMIDVNLTGVFLSMRAELKHMATHDGGAIVNVSSIAGLSPTLGFVHYTAAKHGVIGLTRSGAAEYAGKVRVNVILPGATDTPFMQKFLQDNPELRGSMRAQPGTGTFATPDQMAAAAVWLCSDAASYVSGVTMPVDGGRLLH